MPVLLLIGAARAPVAQFLAKCFRGGCGVSFFLFFALCTLHCIDFWSRQLIDAECLLCTTYLNTWKRDKKTQLLECVAHVCGNKIIRKSEIETEIDRE